MSKTWKTKITQPAKLVDCPVLMQGPTGVTRVAWLVIDTGSPVSIVRAELAAEIGLTEAMSIGPSRLISPTGPELGYRAPSAQFSIFGRVLKDFIVHCHHLSPELDVDGVVGLDVTQRGRLVFEMPAQRVTFTWI